MNLNISIGTAIRGAATANALAMCRHDYLGAKIYYDAAERIAPELFRNNSVDYARGNTMPGIGSNNIYKMRLPTVYVLE